MASAKALTFGDRKSFALLRDPAPHGIYAAQLFGADPDTLAKAILLLREKGIRFDILDINMGCPAPKITSGGAGSRLLLDPALCGAMVAAARRALGDDTPLTVKMRIGWDAEHLTGVEVARQCEANGADLLAVHGRTREQMYIPPVDAEAIAAIKSETESMKQLIEQLLFLARGENHSLKLNPEPFDLAELAEDIVREAKLIDESHEYKFKVYSSAEVFADKQFIKQAVRVLIENAEKFSADGETISIRVRAWDQKASIEVQDNGIGIDAADVPRIFDRFYRSDESRARKTGGSGLGLAIAQWIATQHKAYYEVISQIDIGTRISLVLPQADASSIESN